MSRPARLREWSSPSGCRMPLWTALPICPWGPLAFSAGSFMEYREWALPEPSSLAFALMLRDILTDALFAEGGVEGGGKVTSAFLRTLPSWVWASYWPLWVHFSVFQKTLSSGNVSNRPIAQCLTSAGSRESSPGIGLCHQWVGHAPSLTMEMVTLTLSLCSCLGSNYFLYEWYELQQMTCSFQISVFKL